MIPRFKADQEQHKWLDALLEVGAIIIEEVAPPGSIETFNRDLQPEYERVGAGFQNDFNGYRTRRVGGIAEHSKEFQTLFTHPDVLALANGVLALAAKTFGLAARRLLKF